MRILVDMDEVLADFVGGVARAFSIPLSEIEQHWEAGCFDIIQPLNKALPASLSEGEFWSRLEWPGFWGGLDRLPWATRLIKAIGEITDNYFVVTSPSRGRYCMWEKQDWLNRFFGVAWWDRMIPTPHKAEFAEPNTVLIDDRESTIDAFRKRGGSGILFPRHHNRLRGMKSDPLGHVLAELSRFACGDRIHGDAST